MWLLADERILSLSMLFCQGSPESLFGSGFAGLGTFEQWSGLVEHQDRENGPMHTDQRVLQPLIVAHETPKPSGPSKAALDHPTTRQQRKAVLGFGQLLHFQRDTVLGRRGWGLETFVTL